MDNYITTWLDVVQEVPHYFDFETGLFQNVSKGRILKAIKNADAYVKAKLRPYYGSNLSIGVDRFQTEVLKTNSDSNLDFVFDESAITVVSQFTQVYKFIYNEVSTNPATVNVTVIPDTGAEITGANTGTLNLTKIQIGTGAWSGKTFYKGDTFYLAHYHYEEMLVTLATKYAAANLLMTTANSQLAADGPSGAGIKGAADNLMDEIMSSNDNLLEIALKAQDTSPIEVGYDINEFGEDQTTYL